jgi:hypothetical protein
VKKIFLMLFVLTVTAFVAAAICAADELVMNPTPEQLEGTWSGYLETERFGGRDVRELTKITFIKQPNGKIVFGTGVVVSINNATISASSSEREILLKMYKSGSKLFLRGNYSKTGLGRLSSKTTGGTYELEKQPPKSQLETNNPK